MFSHAQRWSLSSPKQGSLKEGSPRGTGREAPSGSGSHASGCAGSPSGRGGSPRLPGYSLSGPTPTRQIHKRLSDCKHHDAKTRGSADTGHRVRMWGFPPHKKRKSAITAHLQGPVHMGVGGDVGSRPQHRPHVPGAGERRHRDRSLRARVRVRVTNVRRTNPEPGRPAGRPPSARPGGLGRASGSRADHGAGLGLSSAGAEAWPHRGDGKGCCGKATRARTGRGSGPAGG